MGILYEKVIESKKAEKKVLIKELQSLGIVSIQNRPLEEIDYYTLLRALSVARIRIESEENGWY
jgi:hypothetical protein